MAGWNADTAAGSPGPGAVTLVEGSSFCISGANGDIRPEYPHGVFVEDTRILSRWNVSINGASLEPLAAKAKEPYRAIFVGRVPRSDGHADSPLIVERFREVGAGILEQITVRNYSTATVACVVGLQVEADFADLFEVKEARIQRHWEESREAKGDSLTIRAAWQDVRKGVVVSAEGADITPGDLVYPITVPPHGHWSTTVSVVPLADDSSSVAQSVRAKRNQARSCTRLGSTSPAVWH